MLLAYALFVILFFILLLICLIVIYFLLFHTKPAPHSSSSIIGNTHQDSTPAKPEHLIEIPLQDPTSPGFRPMKSNLADSQSPMQLLLLLESAFDESAGKADISKVKEFFGPGGEGFEVGSGCEVLDLSLIVSKSTSTELLNYLSVEKNNYTGFLEQAHDRTTVLLRVDFRFFLHYFLHPDIFDPKKEFESMSELELKVLESILLDARKFRERKECSDRTIFAIESFNGWDDLRVFVNNRASQRRLLLELCFVSFDGLNDQSFRHIFSEFLNRPRASPWITNNRLVMAHYYADQIISLIAEHQLVSRESLSKLSECSSAESEKEYFGCLERIKVNEIIPLNFIKCAIFSKFPLWPNSWHNYELSFLIPKLLDKVHQLPEYTNRNLPFVARYSTNDMYIFKHFQVRHFSLGLLKLLENFTCKHDYKSPDFELSCSNYDQESWKKCFSPEFGFVFPLNEIDKLFVLYSTRLSEIEQIVNVYTSNEPPAFSQAQLDLIQDIANNAKDTMLLVAYEANPGDALLQFKSNFSLFALLADITRFNFAKIKYESERAESDAEFSRLKVKCSYSQVMEYLSYISDKERFSGYLNRLNEGYLNIMNHSIIVYCKACI